MVGALPSGLWLLALATAPATAQPPALPVLPAKQQQTPSTQPQGDAPDKQAAPTDQPAPAPAPTAAPPQSLDEIYMKVFKRKPGPLQRLDYPVLLDEMPQGAFLVEPDRDNPTEGRVAAAIIGKVLVPAADPAFVARLMTLAGDRDMVAFSELRALGYEVRFDPARLVLEIASRLEMRGVRTLALRPSGSPQGVTLSPQADVSAYVSARVGGTFVAETPAGATGLQRVVGDLDLALNVKGIVAEARLRYDDDAPKRLGRDDIRLTYDDRKRSIRFELGDLSIGRSAYQDSPRIMGIGAFRFYNINPYRNIRPAPGYGFELTEAAEVEVLVNGLRVRTFALQGGRYDLRNLPLLSSATNDIQVIIRYQSGRVENLSFPGFFDLDLLAPGLTEFAFNLGVPYSQNRNQRSYDTSTYSGLAFVRHGLSSTLTAGLNWQGDRHLTLVGAELVWASPIGTFGVNGAIDLKRFSASAGQLNLQYRWRDNDTARGWAIDGVLTMTGADYRTLNNLGFGSIVATQGRVRIGRALGPLMTAQAFAGFERYRGGLPATYFVGANVSRTFGRVLLALEGEFSRRDNGHDFTARLGLSVPLGRGALSGSATSERNAVRLQYDRPPGQGAGQLGFAGGLDWNDDSDRQFLRASYFGNRFEASIQQTSLDYLHAGRGGDLRYDVRLGGALVMADGHFSLSRPVGNSFVMVGRNRRAGNYRLAVEPLTGFGSTRRLYSAFSDGLGPAVVTGITPYFNRTLQVDAPDAPAGVSVGGQVFVFNPGYRSGAYVEVGSEGNVTAIGNLVDRDGDPLSLLSLALRELCEGKCEKSTEIPIFTNTAGRFYAEHLKAGAHYEFELSIDNRLVRQRLDIPDDALGLFRLQAPLAFDIDVPGPQQGDPHD